MERVHRYGPINQNDKTILHIFLLTERRILSITYKLSLQVHDHAESLINGFLAPMRTLRSTSTVLPRAGMEDSIDNIAPLSTCRLTREANLKSNCLSCDGQRCVVTKLLDAQSVPHNDTTSLVAYTECATIVGSSISNKIHRFLSFFDVT
ncbi:hypothetical protein N7447_007654 [Penicillium robsamsonii]|uniref:uncharacterized protein n=1 Tax=Penicillium robsamsonii TaxID=1792511 RepID=UPI002546D0F2|nr:uncharacterized protein N7447_007654 [Penicillium robsamsonii]KAJ5817646.1 hypothetical protein N7447_007654 [Penicillium robsamsonii]